MKKLKEQHHIVVDENGYEYHHLKVPVKERISTILEILGVDKDESEELPS